MLELSIGCSDCPIASVPVARIGPRDLKAEVWCPGKYNCDEQLTFGFYQHTASNYQRGMWEAQVLGSPHQSEAKGGDRKQAT